MNPTNSVSLQSTTYAAKPMVVNGFTIDLSQGSATKLVNSSDGTKQFRMVVPLNNLKDQKSIENHLSRFTDECCKKGADVCVKMGLGAEKVGKQHVLTHLSFNINSENRKIESITKGYEGKENKEIKDLTKHYESKLEKHKGSEGKLQSVQGKVQAFVDFNTVLNKKSTTESGQVNGSAMQAPARLGKQSAQIEKSSVRQEAALALKQQKVTEVCSRLDSLISRLDGLKQFAGPKENENENVCGELIKKAEELKAEAAQPEVSLKDTAIKFNELLSDFKAISDKVKIQEIFSKADKLVTQLNTLKQQAAKQNESEEQKSIYESLDDLIKRTEEIKTEIEIVQPGTVLKDLSEKYNKIVRSCQGIEGKVKELETKNN